MGVVTTIRVREVPAGWRVERRGGVLLPPTSQDRAMLTALSEASASFDRGERAQVVVAPLAAAATHP